MNNNELFGLIIKLNLISKEINIWQRHYRSSSSFEIFVQITSSLQKKSFFSSSTFQWLIFLLSFFNFNFQPTHYLTITTHNANEIDAIDSGNGEKVHLKKLVGQMKTVRLENSRFKFKLFSCDFHYRISATFPFWASPILNCFRIWILMKLQT